MLEIRHQIVLGYASGVHNVLHKHKIRSAPIMYWYVTVPSVGKTADCHHGPYTFCVFSALFAYWYIANAPVRSLATSPARSGHHSRQELVRIGTKS